MLNNTHYHKILLHYLPSKEKLRDNRIVSKFNTRGRLRELSRLLFQMVCYTGNVITYKYEIKGKRYSGV